MQRSVTIPEHLKTIDIKCEVVNEKVVNVLKFLGTFNICKRTRSNVIFYTYFCVTPSYDYSFCPCVNLLIPQVAAQ